MHCGVPRHQLSQSHYSKPPPINTFLEESVCVPADAIYTGERVSRRENIEQR